MTTKFLLGVDIGGTKTALVIGDENFQIVNRIEFLTRVEEGFDNFLKNLLDSIPKIKEGHHINAVGVAVGGPLDAKKGILYNPPHLGWGTIHLLEEFEKALDASVKVEHDAKAEALAEWKLGAGKGFKDVVFLTLGTGLGAGIIVNGQLYRGASDIAGEVGHVRIENYGPTLYGKNGSWESYCSGSGISKLAHFMFPSYFKEDIGTPEISSLASSGEWQAVSVLQKSGEYLGRGLALLFDVLDPERIILGPLSWRLPGLWLESAFEVLKKESLLGENAISRVVKSELKEKVGDFGALVVASEALKGGEFT